jgi:hypothetical protein
MTGVRIAGALAWFWYSGVPWGEARARTDAALAAADAQNVPDAARPPPTRPRSRSCCTRSRVSPSSPGADRMLALSGRAAPLWDAVDAACAADPAVERAFGARARRGRATMRGMAGSPTPCAASSTPPSARWARLWR